MTAIEVLKQHGRMPAEHIAAWLRVPIVEVYAELVRANDAGLARVNCPFKGAPADREWEAMEEVPA